MCPNEAQKLNPFTPDLATALHFPYRSNIWALWRSGLGPRASRCQKLKMVGYTSMPLNCSNSSNLEQLALKGLIHYMYKQHFQRSSPATSTILTSVTAVQHLHSTKSDFDAVLDRNLSHLTL